MKRLRRLRRRKKKEEARKKIEKALKELGLKYGDAVPCERCTYGQWIFRKDCFEGDECHNNVSYHRIPDGENLCDRCLLCPYCGKDYCNHCISCGDEMVHAWCDGCGWSEY